MTQNDTADETGETDRDWKVEGAAHVCGLEGLPERVLEMHETDRYAVFSSGEILLLVPDTDVDPLR